MNCHDIWSLLHNNKGGQWDTDQGRWGAHGSPVQESATFMALKSSTIILKIYTSFELSIIYPLSTDWFIHCS